jgi:hypothetical protein
MRAMILKRFSHTTLIIIVGLVLTSALGGYLWYAGYFTPQEQEVKQQTKIDEAALQKDLAALKEVPGDFTSLRGFFVELAQEKGGVYAFELLKRAILPPNTDFHLMGHAVGDELYKQEDLDGIKYCTHDFRNACSHSIVVGALLKDGLSVFDRVNEVCKQSPGGPGAYTMCFHGFGHGVLAFTEYEVPEAVKLCGKVGTAEYHYEEEYQCIGGIIMEMHQGIHDPEIWAAKKDKYLTAGDPLRLCREDYMPDGAKMLCYSYITPYIFDAAGAVNGNPTPELYPKSFAYCDEVEDAVLRDACSAGLGKEFIVLAQDRDIRKLSDMTDDRLELAASWCGMAEKKEAEQACLISILDSLFWGGENDPEVSIRYCSIHTDTAIADACFGHLFEIATYYVPNPKDRENICSLVPEGRTAECTETLL